MKLGSAILLVCCSTLFGQHPSSTRFVYAISGAPAAEVKVDVSGADKDASYTTDASGRIPVTLPVGRVHVTDPKTGITLLEQGIASPTAELAIGMPLQLTGEVSGFGSDPAQIQIDCGYGERVAVSNYERLHANLQLLPHAGEDTIQGMALPPIPGQSKRVHPDADGRFRTGWFAAMDSPELLVFGGPDSRAAAKTIKLSKGTRPGATVPVGRIVPEFGAILEVNLSLPKTDLPMALMMGVAAIQAGPGGRQKMAETLSREHRLNPETALFLARRREIPLNFQGVTKVAGLPPIDSLKLYFGGPMTGTLLERTMKIPAQGVVRIDLSADDVLGTREPRTTLTGVLRYEGGGQAIANATVVYSSYPDKKETKTGPDGRFEIPGVIANRAGVLLIDVPNPGERPPFDRFTITRPVPALPAAPAAAAATPQVFEVPHPAPGGFLIQTPLPGRQDQELAGSAARAGLAAESLLQQTVINYQFRGCNQYTQDELQYGGAPILTVYEWVDRKAGTLAGPIEVTATGTVKPDSSAVMQITFPKSGDFALFLEYTPFVFSVTGALVFDTLTGTIFFNSFKNFPGVTIQVKDRNNHNAPAGVELNFPSWSPEPDPFVALTDFNGRVSLSCLTNSTQLEAQFIPIYVNDATAGYYSGNLPLGQGGVLTLNLGNPPNFLAKPGKKSK